MLILESEWFLHSILYCLILLGEFSALSTFDVAFRRIHTLMGHKAEISSAQFNWDCSLIATGSMDKKCKIWDASSGQKLCSKALNLNVISTVLNVSSPLLFKGSALELFLAMMMKFWMWPLTSLDSTCSLLLQILQPGFTMLPPISWSPSWKDMKVKFQRYDSSCLQLMLIKSEF